jgi:hypothetical protein
MEERENEEGPGVPDMTLMPQITEPAINDNLKRRYKYDLVYVSFVMASISLLSLHTYHSRFIAEGVPEASQILLRDAHILPCPSRILQM